MIHLVINNKHFMFVSFFLLKNSVCIPMALDIEFHERVKS